MTDLDDLIFDTHSHYDDSAYDDDRDELLSSMKAGGVGYIVDISASIQDMQHILELTQRYDFMYAAAGLHPTEAPEFNDENFSAVTEMLHHEKVMAVGEIGLDYHYEDTNKTLQKEWFAAQIALAKQEKCPIVVHSREAAADTLDMIKSEGARDVGGVIHCFSYEKEMARLYLDMGFYIGIGGVLTFKNARKLVEVVQYMPMEQMLLETDCPYLAPVPHRGERNDSTMIRYVVDKIAEIKGIDRQKIISTTTANARKMYRI